MFVWALNVKNPIIKTIEEIFENILGKPKKPKPTMVAGQPVDDIIEELSKLLPGG